MEGKSIGFALPDGYSFPAIPNEQFLHFIWQYQYFNKQSLKLDNGDEFQVVHQGRYNTNPGPTFIEAKIKIEGTLWVGNIELYLKTSDLTVQKHLLDKNKDNVLLYVVWENDQPNVMLQIPVFSLQSKASTINQPILEKGEKQHNSSNESSELVSSNEKDMLKKERKVIKSLYELIVAQKKSPILNGDIRSLKIVTWQRQTIRFYVEYGGHAKHVPKILLLGNWLAKAGFDCEDRINVIPLTNMLIIIPEKL